MPLLPSYAWRLLIAIPASVSGAMSATVALLLLLQRKERLFRSFFVLTVLLTIFGIDDAIVSIFLRGAAVNASYSAYFGLGVSYLMLIGLLVRALFSFTADLRGKKTRLALTILSYAPLACAAASCLLPFAPAAFQSGAALALIAKAFLSALFAACLACGILLTLSWRGIHDRLFRRIVAGTGFLLLCFIPLWILEILGLLRVSGFFLFLFLWNSGALISAARAYFKPRQTANPDELFSAGQLEACAARYGLSPREKEISGLHAAGFSSKEIGDRLCISPKTVRNHVTNIYLKTGSAMRRELLHHIRS